MKIDKRLDAACNWCVTAESMMTCVVVLCIISLLAEHA